MPIRRASHEPFADRLCAVIATPTAAEALAQIQDELACHRPSYADDYRRSASHARRAAHQAREIERQFSD